jgi:hypothetical protein
MMLKRLNDGFDDIAMRSVAASYVDVRLLVGWPPFFR